MELEQHIDSVCIKHNVPYLSEVENKNFFEFLEQEDTIIQWVVDMTH